MAVRVDASGDSLSRTTNLPAITSFTIMGWFRIVTDRNDWGSFISFGDASGVNYLTWGVNATGTKLMLYNGSSSQDATTDMTVGTWYHLALTCKGTGLNDLVAYVNGVAEVTKGMAGGVTAGKLWIMSDNDTEWINGRCCALKVFTVALTAAEVQQEMYAIRPVTNLGSLNSWFPQFSLSAERTKDYSGNGRDLTAGGTLTDEDPPGIGWGGDLVWTFENPSGGAAYTLTTDQVSFALTGQAMTPKVGRVVALAQGSFALTGQVTALNHGYKSVLAQGSFALSGQSVALNHGYKLIAAQGSFALTGIDLAFRRTLILAFGQGAFSISGQSATLRRGYLFGLAAGSYALTGNATETYAGRYLALAQASFALTGIAATLSRASYTLALAQGSFSFTGQDATLRAARYLALALGSFAETGQAAVLFRGRYLALAAATFALTGQDVVMKRGVRLPTAVATFALSGQATTLRAAHLLGLSAGSFVVAGQATTFRLGHALPTSTASFALTGQSVTFKAAHVAPLVVGTFALTGSAAALNKGRTLALTVGTFALTGQTLGTKAARTLTLASGSFALTGFDVAMTASGAVEPEAGIFSPEHASALLDVMANGAALSLTKRTRPGYDPLTGLNSQLIETVAGYGIQVPANAEVYRAGTLIGKELIEILFVPTTYGEKPAVGAIGSWAGEPVVVESVDPVEPDGMTIMATLVLRRAGEVDAAFEVDGAFGAEHASAVEDLRTNGDPVTFTDVVLDYDELTGSRSSSTVTVPGYAIRTRGAITTKDGNELVDPVALLFAATTYGDRPMMGARCSWDGQTYVVRDVRPFYPDGKTILSKVTVSR